jgi:hypothetical protein
MNKLVLFLLLGLCAFAGAQDTGDQTQPPSTPEILELAAKAKEKTDAFRVAIIAAKADISQTLYSDDIAAADAADEIIKGVRSRGSAYSVVALVTILDDLTLDASRAETQLATRVAIVPPDDRPRVMMETMTIVSAENGC